MVPDERRGKLRLCWSESLRLQIDSRSEGTSVAVELVPRIEDHPFRESRRDGTCLFQSLFLFACLPNRYLDRTRVVFQFCPCVSTT